MKMTLYPHFKPKKSLSQNFLLDKTVIDKLVNNILQDECIEDIFVEIGPGLGALTFALLPHIPLLYAIEKDECAIKILQSLSFDMSDKLRLISADALNFPYQEIAKHNKIKLFGNLPYNISSQLLIMFTKNILYLKDVHVMLQKEVAQRLIAVPGTKNYSRLSVMIQSYFTCEILLEVAPHAFYPRPEVFSSFVRLRPTITEKIKNPKLLAQIVLLAFQQRRKQLRNSWHSLSNYHNNLPCELSLRAEDLSVTEYIKVANYLDFKTMNE